MFVKGVVYTLLGLPGGFCVHLMPARNLKLASDGALTSTVGLVEIVALACGQESSSDHMAEADQILAHPRLPKLCRILRHDLPVVARITIAVLTEAGNLLLARQGRLERVAVEVAPC